MAYAAAQGVFLGAISAAYEGAYAAASSSRPSSAPPPSSAPCCSATRAAACAPPRSSPRSSPSASSAWSAVLLLNLLAGAFADGDPLGISGGNPPLSILFTARPDRLRRPDLRPGLRPGRPHGRRRRAGAGVLAGGASASSSGWSSSTSTSCACCPTCRARLAPPARVDGPSPSGVAARRRARAPPCTPSLGDVRRRAHADRPAAPREPLAGAAAAALDAGPLGRRSARRTAPAATWSTTSRRRSPTRRPTLEGEPRRALPRLDSDLALADQLAVTADDLVRAAPAGRASPAPRPATCCVHRQRPARRRGAARRSPRRSGSPTSPSAGRAPARRSATA